MNLEDCTTHRAGDDWVHCKSGYAEYDAASMGASLHAKSISLYPSLWSRSMVAF